MNVEELILSEACPPLLISDAVSDWPASRWNLTYLADQLGGKTFSCKLAKRENSSSTKYETDCSFTAATIAEFIQWNTGATSSLNPLNNFPKDSFTCYVDYKYMKDMFDAKEDLLQDVKWDVFGLEGRNGYDSTIWIGSDGANTPCHYDTYGFNIVAQIYGRKKWLLFPPSDTEYLYPTRIPYEESSVFTLVDVAQPDLKKFPLFKKCSPVEIILEPGQVLFVPRHWWHYVECLEPCISINTWVEMEEDTEERLCESVTRFLFSSFYDQCLNNLNASSTDKWLNPNEELMPFTVNLKYVEAMLRTVKNLGEHACGLEEINYKDSKHSQNLYRFARSLKGILAYPHTRSPNHNSGTNISGETTGSKQRKRHVEEDSSKSFLCTMKNKKCCCRTDSDSLRAVNACKISECDGSHSARLTLESNSSRLLQDTATVLHDAQAETLIESPSLQQIYEKKIKVNYLRPWPYHFPTDCIKCSSAVEKMSDTSINPDSKTPHPEGSSTVSMSVPFTHTEGSDTSAKQSADVVFEEKRDASVIDSTYSETDVSDKFVKRLVSSLLHPTVIEKIVDVLKTS